MLKGKTLKLHPFVGTRDSEAIYHWFYDPSCANMWRHHTRSLTQEDVARYPQLIGGEVFMIELSGAIVGFCQAIPDCKTNRGVYAGILLDKEARGLHLVSETFAILFNHLFNKQGYQKAIIEVVAQETKLCECLVQAGCNREGILINEAFLNGRFVDEARFSISADDYNRRYQTEVQAWAV